MEKAVINASPRSITGKKVSVLRREGKLPGVLYGHNFTTTPIVMDLKSAARVLASITESSIVTVSVDGKENATLVREKQRDYIRGTLLHVDFQVISLTEKLRTHVSIEIIGLSPAVKNFNGMVITGLDELDVECLPQYLPEKIVVDISGLQKIGDGIRVSDLKLDDHITVYNHVEDQIVHISNQKVEEEVTTVEGEVSNTEPEVIEKGKKEEEVAD
jgi:large subunit ribosomal protein L25